MTTELAKAEGVLQAEQNNKPQEKDPKDKLTEFAFKLDRSLLGLPLATPWQRLIALSIDMLLIAMLSDTSGELLALFIAVTFYRLGKKDNEAIGGKERGRKRRKALRITGGFILFVLLLDVTPKVFDFFEGESSTSQQASVVTGQELSFEEGVTIAALTTATIGTVKTSECQQLACWQEELSPIVSGLHIFSIPDDKLLDAFGEVASNTNLSQNLQTALSNSMLELYKKEHAAFLEAKKLEESAEALENPDVNVSETIEKLDEPEQGYGYSIMSWVKGIINDLGLGFGWAAFYFTASIVIWKGQTPGKKVMGIRVVQLDGTPLSLWDSFGRYGGYGAGIATGLLGFMQIFWDPNRQAIHDKISATVVIKGAVIKNEAAKAAEVFAEPVQSKSLPQEKD